MSAVQVKIALTNPGDRNERMTEELAHALLANWKSLQSAHPDHVIDRLDLSCRVYPLVVTKLLVDYLKKGDGDHVANLEHAHLNDIIASLMTDEGLEVLTQINELLKDAPLKTLEISDNALGVRGIFCLGDLFSKPTLERFAMENDGISHESMQFLGAKLATDKLKELYIYNNMIGVEGARETGAIVAKCRHLETFRYEGCRPQPEGTTTLLEGLDTMTQHTKASPTMKALYLEGSINDSNSRKILCQVLQRVTTTLTALRLYDCSLDRSACRRVLRVLSPNTILTDLHLGQNEMGHGKGLECLLSLLQRNQLTKLNVNANELTSAGVEQIGQALSQIPESETIQLTELHLRENLLGDRAAVALVNIAKRLTVNLQVLELSENGLSDESVKALQEAFGEALQELEDNDPEEDFDDMIEDESDDEEEDDEDDDVQEEPDQAVDALADALSQAHV